MNVFSSEFVLAHLKTSCLKSNFDDFDEQVMKTVNANIGKIINSNAHKNSTSTDILNLQREIKDNQKEAETFEEDVREKMASLAEVLTEVRARQAPPSSRPAPCSAVQPAMHTLDKFFILLLSSVFTGKFGSVVGCCGTEFYKQIFALQHFLRSTK